MSRTDDNENTVVPDPSRILMSDVLRDVLPDDLKPTDELGAMAQNYVMVILGTIYDGADERPMIGTLESLMFQDDILEIEAKVMLDEGMTVMSSAPGVDNGVNITFSFIELHNNEKIIKFNPKGGYALAGARLVSIDYRRRMCVLLLNLRHGA